METSMSRRKFIRKTSLGTAGVALSLGSAKSLRGNFIQNTEKPAILGGTPVRSESNISPAGPRTKHRRFSPCSWPNLAPKPL